MGTDVMTRELKLPALGENVETADVVAVLVAVGDEVKRGQSVIEVETEKASAEVPSELEGVVEQILVKVGDKIRVGQPILAMGTGAGVEAPAPAAVEAPAPAQEAAPRREPAPEAEREKHGESVAVGEPAPASPSVRRLARELGVDIHRVPGSGPGARISVEDVKAYAREVISGWAGHGALGAGAAAIAAASLPDFSKWGEVRREPMSNVRRKTAENMLHAWSTIPHVTQCDLADITHLEEFRRRYGPKVEAAGGKLTMTAIVIWVVAAALKAFPKFNSSVDVEREEIIYKQYVNIGLAVDTERGLLVPVIRDADRKSLAAIAVEATELARRARERKLTIDEMRGGNFSVTNLGGLGTTTFSPIVNWPDVAILGVGRAREEAVLAGGQWVPRLILPLSLSYDHRVIDGADAARFLRWVAETLEQPLVRALEG